MKINMLIVSKVMYRGYVFKIDKNYIQVDSCKLFIRSLFCEKLYYITIIKISNNFFFLFSIESLR